MRRRYELKVRHFAALLAIALLVAGCSRGPDPALESRDEPTPVGGDKVLSPAPPIERAEPPMRNATDLVATRLEPLTVTVAGASVRLTAVQATTMTLEVESLGQPPGSYTTIALTFENLSSHDADIRLADFSLVSFASSVSPVSWLPLLKGNPESRHLVANSMLIATLFFTIPEPPRPSWLVVAPASSSNRAIWQVA